jgi:hypothetical protein
MFVAIRTMLNISHTISILSYFNSRPTSRHFTMVKSILYYLKTTRYLYLSYKRIGKDEIMDYANLDWARSLNNRRLTGSYVLTFNRTSIS